MKYFALALALFCAVSYASADWKADVRETHWVKTTTYIVKQLAVVENEEKMKGTPEARKCLRSAQSRIVLVFTPFDIKLNECIDKASNEQEANKCADSVDKLTEIQALVITNEALACILVA